MKVKRYCTCGDSMIGSATGGVLDHLLSSWDRVHSGPGHAECDQKTAAKARRNWDRVAPELIQSVRRADGWKVKMQIGVERPEDIQ